MFRHLVFLLLVLILGCQGDTIHLGKAANIGTTETPDGNTLGEPGYTQCTGTIGDFDVWLYPAMNDPDKFELYVTPYELPIEGEIASIHIANSALEYKELAALTGLNKERAISLGTLTKAEVLKYNILAITLYDPNVDFADQVSDQDAFCEYNLPPGISR